MNLTNNEIIHISGENLEYIQFRRLLEYKDIINHAYTLKHPTIYFGPNLKNEECQKNYQALCQDLSLNVNHIVRPNQKHTNLVKIIL